MAFKRQIGVPLYYKGELISEYRPDLVVADRVIVEIKAFSVSSRFTPLNC